MVTYVFDGTLEGLLTAVFEFYERKPGKIQLVAAHHFQPMLLEETLEVISDDAKAKRVWDGLKKKIAADWQKRFYTAFLSEDAATFQHLFNFACYIFDNEKGAEQNFGNPSVMAISKMERSVSRERHRMKAFVRFQETADGIFYAPVEPDFNVLPLIVSFFKNRYADQRWIIYDRKRNYGLYYDLDKVEEIVLEETPKLKSGSGFLSEDVVQEKEELYGLLWNDYFKSTNIPARKNMKLHIRHVPKRYWKYLSEKQTPEKLYFIAIIPPKQISEEVTLFKRDFASHYDSCKALKVVPHITLKAPFKILQTDHKTLVSWFQKLTFSTEKFDLELRNFGSFPNAEYPVIFVNPIVSEALNNLQKTIIEKFQITFPGVGKQHTDYSFHPHMTIAYRDLTFDNYQKAWEIYKDKTYEAKFSVEEFHLLQHDGTKWNITATNFVRTTDS